MVETSLDKKIFVYVAVGILIAMLGVIVVLPSSGIFKNMFTPNASTPTALTSVMTEVKPLDIKFNGSSIVSVGDRDAMIETKFNLTNPNDNTLIIEMVTYDIYANGVVIGHGQYGQRYDGTWESSSYLPLTQHNSEIITVDTKIINDGNNPQIWSALQNHAAAFRFNGTAYYSTHSAFAGQAYTKDFDFLQ
jgi:LEA14-like dessication related protein